MLPDSGKYLIGVCREMALQSPALSRVYGQRLLKVLGRELPRQRQQGEAAEVLRSVCGGCGQYLLPPYNSDIDFDFLEEGSSGGSCIDLSKRIAAGNLASKYSITCTHCNTTTIVPVQLLRASQPPAEDRPPSKPSPKAVKTIPKPSPKPKKQPRSKPSQPQQTKRKKPDTTSCTTPSFKDFLKGM
eukprot:TRINITY_DN27571_c0_g1_i1.p1 TRINITY_DN27571_c0_g1~~TRINITY_DN27571_c0_g1_i1.p1  ORF type:complete len:186 (+),score=31.52 TRINITY_DN27571_c0_g1_i1:64-621(+)